MTKPLLFCLLLAASCGVVNARGHRDHEEKRAFVQSHPCPATGEVSRSCPGWQVGYIVELCAGGQDKRDNMRWITPQDKRFIREANGKDCKNLKPKPLLR